VCRCVLVCVGVRVCAEFRFNATDGEHPAPLVESIRSRWWRAFGIAGERRQHRSHPLQTSHPHQQSIVDDINVGNSVCLLQWLIFASVARLL